MFASPCFHWSVISLSGPHDLLPLVGALFQGERGFFGGCEGVKIGLMDSLKNRPYTSFLMKFLLQRKGNGIISSRGKETS